MIGSKGENLLPTNHQLSALCEHLLGSRSPTMKAARLQIESCRLLFILLDSKAYILNTSKSVRCFWNSTVYEHSKVIDKASLKQLVYLPKNVVWRADGQTQLM